MTIEALFNNLTPGMCRLTPGRFDQVKKSVLTFFETRKGANIRNTSKEQEHKNTASVIPYPGSFDAVSASFDGSYYQDIKRDYTITETKTETGIETLFYPGSFDAVTGEYKK